VRSSSSGPRTAYLPRSDSFSVAMAASIAERTHFGQFTLARFLSPSVLTLTCLDPWRQCQVLAECRDKDGAAHQGLLPAISAGATAVHSASTLANNLTPTGFLTATTENPGHCQLHGTQQLSVLH
ncbi:MAG: hypothetical protein OXP11_05905, partial [Gammaproteobacteria bacterium]|nr:hypothetical protein [Gammaproteobacteria bacterium]